MSQTGVVTRSAIYEALKILTDAGFYTERIIGSSRRFDIVAWKGGRTLCVLVRSARYAKLASFRELVRGISRMIASEQAPGEIQFWIYRTPGWSRYRITSGGASPIVTWDISSVSQGAIA